MSRRSFRILKTVLRTLGGLLIAVMVGVLVFRIFTSSNDPKEVSTLLVNDRTKEAYEKNGKDGLTLFYQTQNTLTRAQYDGVPGEDFNFKNKDNYGYFGITKSLFLKEAHQAQIVFRYNNGTLQHLKEDYGLEALPDKNADHYDVTLVLAIDLTPEDESDNLTAEPGHVQLLRIQPDREKTVSSSQNRYNYRRFLFDLPEEVSFDDILAVYVDIYYNRDITYLEEDADIYKDIAYGTLCIYDYKSESYPYRLTKEDLKALEG